MSNTLRSLALLARGIGIAAGAFAIAHIGNLSLGEHGLAVWWPLNGIIVATLMIAPRERTARILTAVTAGNLAAYIYSDFGILSGWYALGDAAEISIATWGLRRFVGDRVALSDTRHVLAIVVTAVFAAIPPGLVCAVLAARVGHHGFLSFFRTWWLADALGMILAAPAVVGLVDLFRRRRSFATRVWIESGLMTVLTFAAAAAAMSQSSIGTMDLAADARYLVFPFLIWSALRLSPQVTAVAVMTGALSAACIATPFVHPVMASAVAHMFAIQLFLGIVGVTALLLAATAQGMRDALTRVVDSEGALRRLSVDLDRAREDERARISAEIHDELGQELTALKMEVARRTTDDPRWRLAVLPQIDRTIASVRRLATDLRPPSLDHLGLPAAIESHTQQFTRRTGIRTRVSIGQAGHGVKEEPALALYRVVQEALTNVARHARARSVSVDMTEDEFALVLEIADDGAGFDEVGKGQGLGILGMRERLARVGASFAIERRHPAGTLVRCRLPLARKVAA
ncbi:MAG TPA: MASE1 domain-containing protein [Vicinamibacterales bacterium]|nr:MASE1 domain-containing protein [Vicinamibacterales bacterium]